MEYPRRGRGVAAIRPRNIRTVKYSNGAMESQSNLTTCHATLTDATIRSASFHLLAVPNE